jgi:glucokinase
MDNILLADIGATNCRFAIVAPNGRPENMVKLRGDAVPSLEAGIEHYIAQIGMRPRAAVLAIAAPVDGDAVAMTNRPWRFRLSELAGHFGWQWVRGLNDFEAAAWSLPCLAGGDVRALGPAQQVSGECKVIFGPGTGLGVAALVPVGNKWQVLSSEGGHASFGPAHEDETAIFERMRAECGFVSVERALSGPGLERLHRAVSAGARLSAAAIIEAAHAGDRAGLATVALFARLMARFAGDLALTFKALGGVYIGGGVARRIGPFIDQAAFRTAFEGHPPYEALLRRIPTTLITLDEPGLLGCAAVAETMPSID